MEAKKIDLTRKGRTRKHHDLPNHKPQQMKKNFFRLILAAFLVEVGTFLTLAALGWQSAKMLTLSLILVLPILYVIKRMKNPQFKPLQ